MSGRAHTRATYASPAVTTDLDWGLIKDELNPTNPQPFFASYTKKQLIPYAADRVYWQGIVDLPMSKELLTEDDDRSFHSSVYSSTHGKATTDLDSCRLTCVAGHTQEPPILAQL